MISSEPPNDIFKSEHELMDDIRKDLTIHGKVTTKEDIDLMEYLDDVTYFVNLNTEEDTSLTRGNFIDTNELLNEVEQNRAPPSAHRVSSSTNKASENSRLQISQQRSDDPRRGGKVGIEVREVWNKDPIETSFNSDNMIKASGHTPSDGFGVPIDCSEQLGLQRSI